MIASAATAVLLVLNGAPLDLSPSAYYDAPRGQVMVPVRQMFGKLGWALWVEPRSRVSHAHLDLEGWPGVTLYEGQTSLRINEYVSPLPAPVSLREGRLFAPAMVLEVVMAARVRYDADAGRLEIEAHPEQPPSKVTIGEVTGDPAKWLHQRVRIRARYVGGPVTGPRSAADPEVPAVGARLFRDETGEIHCTECRIVTVLMVWMPEYKPGTQVSMTGIVRTGKGGVPYLSITDRDRL